MNFLFLDIFQRQCPHCQHAVLWCTRRLLLKQAFIKCPECKTLLMIHPRDRLVNLMFLWLFISQFNQIYLQNQSYLIESYMLFLALFFDVLKYVNVFFSLYKVAVPLGYHAKRKK